MRYRTFKTTLGHKYKVRMDRDEIAEKELYNMTIVILPFISTILLMLVWLYR